MNDRESPLPADGQYHAIHHPNGGTSILPGHQIEMLPKKTRHQLSSSLQACAKIERIMTALSAHEHAVVCAWFRQKFYDRFPPQEKVIYP